MARARCDARRANIGRAADACGSGQPYVSPKATKEATMSNETDVASPTQGFALKRIDDMRAIHHGAVKLVPGPEGVRMLAIGCTMAGAYERPADFELEGHR
jgi:hypothetical protein